MDDNVKTPPDNKVAQSRHFKQILFACLCVLVMACLVFFVFPKRSLSPGLVRTQPQQIAVPSPSAAMLANLPAGWTSYTDPDFHLSFGYPASWTLGGIQVMPAEPGSFAFREVRFSDPSSTGFFRTSNSFLLARLTLDDVVNNDCSASTQPCGIKPIIQQLTVAGQDARIIWPSNEARGVLDTVYLFIDCPAQLGIFFMEADRGHMQQIIQTMKFQ